MKKRKFSAAVLALAFICTFPVSGSTPEPEDSIALENVYFPEIIVPEYEIPARPESDEHPGTTPFPEVMMIADVITPEMTETANQIYETFLDAPVEIFNWTEAGIIDSTRMNSADELAYVHNLALEITRDCATTDEKIYALAEYLAKNICYDYDYFYHGTHDYPPIDPYTVLQNGYTVCSGYAKTFEAMLQSLDIPCVYVYAPDHEWSMVHNGNRWMLIDVTWMSGGRYEYGVFNKSDAVRDYWFDFTWETAVNEFNHVVEELPLALMDGILTKYPVESELSYIHWPEGVTGIDDYLFFQCTSFTGDLIIPDSVESIGDCAFYQCTGFTGNLKIGNSVESIGDYAFTYCTGFTGDLTIGDSVKSIGDYAFIYCTGFTGDLKIGNSVESIGEAAFYGCTGFTGDLTIGDSVKSIGEAAFIYCTGFTGDLKIGNSVESIGDYAFYECTGFTGDLIIPDSVESIGYCAFYKCAGFTGNLKIGKSVKSIGDNAFTYCTGFTGNLTLGNNIVSIGEWAFGNCTGFTGDLIIPDRVESIGEAAFYGCTGFTGDLTIGDSVTAIADWAFGKCYGFAGNVIIPDSVESIGYYAFGGNSNIKSAYFYGDVPAVWGGSVFRGGNNFTIYYPEGNTSGWTEPTWTASDGMTYKTRTFKPVVSVSVSVSGTVVSYGSAADEITVVLYDDANAVVSQVTLTGLTAAYEFESVKAGTYTLQIRKENHVGREYTVTAADKDIVQDAVLYLYGDVTLDGDVSAVDLTMLARHVGGIEPIDGDGLLCADVDINGVIDAYDLTKHARYVGGIITDWSQN